VTAGAVGEWWFGAHDVNTIQRAQTRALTTSLGSICVGSLVVAALNALHTLLLSTPRRKAKGSANACLEFLVKLVMRNMQYFNKYAFCQVALYGKDFRLAGTDTMHLFRDRGWTALLNDSLISSVLAVGCLVVGTFARRELGLACPSTSTDLITRDLPCFDRHGVGRHRLRVAVPDAAVHARRAGGAPGRMPYVCVSVW
jgi:hypothetical protein